MIIDVHTRNMALLECFSSESRVRIIELLAARPMNIGELAAAMNLSSAIITKHIQKMEDAGLVASESMSGTRGRRKVCRLLHDSIVLKLGSAAPAMAEYQHYAISIPVGQYSDCKVKPTCGLASNESFIGVVDDPRFFSSPDHIRAAHLWFASGFVRYRIPNYLVGRQRIAILNVSLEICSEAPGYNENWPSDISFSINNVHLGTWTCPGDFGAAHGVFTPRWWNLGTQNGLLKTLSVRQDGTYLDGIKLSDTRVNDLQIAVGHDIQIEIASDESAVHPGGVSLFGRRFGKYDQDIEVTVFYE